VAGFFNLVLTELFYSAISCASVMNGVANTMRLDSSDRSHHSSC